MMYYEEAKKIAVDICKKLQPYCDKINIAGSVRRKKPEVKDIEIICLPKNEEVEIPPKDMFSVSTIEVVRSLLFCDIVKGLGIIEKGKTTGKYMQIHLAEHGINVDLFMPDDFDYYRQYAIRTGSADFTGKVIAHGWKKKGWCGSDKGLRKIKDCQERKTPDGKSVWKCIKENAEKPPVWESEEDFFQWLGETWVHPTKRNDY